MIVVRCYAFISLIVTLPSLGVLGRRHSSPGVLLTHGLAYGAGALSYGPYHTDASIPFAFPGHGSETLDYTREIPRVARAGKHLGSVLQPA